MDTVTVMVVGVVQVESSMQTNAAIKPMPSIALTGILEKTVHTEPPNIRAFAIKTELVLLKPGQILAKNAAIMTELLASEKALPAIVAKLHELNVCV